MQYQETDLLVFFDVTSLFTKESVGEIKFRGILRRDGATVQAHPHYNILQKRRTILRAD